MSARRDVLAVALDRARAAHEKRPGDREAERRFHEAHAAFLAEELRLKSEENGRLTGELARARAETRALKRGIRARVDALFRRAGAAKAERRRRGPAGPLPLLDGGYG